MRQRLEIGQQVGMVAGGAIGLTGGIVGGAVLGGDVMVNQSHQTLAAFTAGAIGTSVIPGAASNLECNTLPRVRCADDRCRATIATTLHTSHCVTTSVQHRIVQTRQWWSTRRGRTFSPAGVSSNPRSHNRI